mmetsp:Transcript_51521/g.149763  ORF Transcript_51521/g.149763 Transcript_51521/m.149763 type:complete len:120 (+) Transcript_51521:1-360(+)
MRAAIGGLGSALQVESELPNDGDPAREYGNIAQVGHIFSRMCVSMSDKDEHIASRRENFIERYPDVARLVQGMLARDPAERWSPEEALRQTEMVMHSRGITVPREQVVLLPAAWSDEES